MADFGATTWRTLGRRGVAICIPAVTQDNEQYFRQIRNRLRICPGRTLLQTLTPYKFLHVIARSEATGQSVLPAVGHDREQCLRRIRKSATNLPQRQQACPLSLRGCGLPQVCALVRNDMLKEGRVRGGKNVARNDIHRLGGLAHTRSRAQCTTFQPGDADCPLPVNDTLKHATSRTPAKNTPCCRAAGGTACQKSLA